MSADLTRFGRFAVRHPFWGFFLLGFAVPIYVMRGAMHGIAEGHKDFQRDRESLRYLVRTRDEGES